MNIGAGAESFYYGRWRTQSLVNMATSVNALCKPIAISNREVLEF